MRPEDLRDATRRAAAARAETFTARLGRGRRLHAKRMASVAAIYTIARFVRTPDEILPPPGTTVEGPARPRPEQKRVWASLEHPPEEVITTMFDEAAHRDPTGQKRWVAVVDGNLPQLDRLQHLAEQRHVSVPIVVDFIHVAQYVWGAALVFFPEDSAHQDRWVRTHLLEILRASRARFPGGYAGVPRAGRCLPPIGSPWTPVRTICSITRRISGTTRPWLRASRSPAASSKGPAVISSTTE
jgi:hypothetical protein